MEITDNGMEYIALLQNVRSKIENIKDLGFGTTEYLEKLKTIHSNLIELMKIDKKNFEKSCFFESALQKNYSDAIKELDSLNEELQKYEPYINIIDTCNYLLNQADNNPTKEQVNEHSLKIVDMLISIRKCEAIPNIDKSREILEKLSSTAYRYIKIEIINFGKSYIYESIMNNKMYLPFFCEYVKKEIKGIDLKKINNEKLKETFNNLNSKKLNNYFDIDIIKLLIGFDQSLVKKFQNEIDSLVKEIDQSNTLIDSKMSYNKEKKERCREHLTDVRTSRKYLAKSIISIILSSSFYIGSFVGLTLGAKKCSTERFYDETITTYSDEYLSETKTNKVSEIFNISDTMPDTIRVYDYGKWYPNCKRKVKVYNVTDFNFDTLNEYLKIPFEELDYSSYIESMEYSEFPDRDNYKEVQYTSYQKTDEKLDFSLLCFLELFVVCFEIVLYGLHSCLAMFVDHFPIIDNIIELIDNLKNLISSKEVYKSEMKKLRQDAQAILEELSKNQELKAKFNSMVKSNKELLSLYEQLNSKLQAVEFRDTEGAKKIMKK